MIIDCCTIWVWVRVEKDLKRKSSGLLCLPRYVWAMSCHELSKGPPERRTVTASLSFTGPVHVTRSLDNRAWITAAKPDDVVLQHHVNSRVGDCPHGKICPVTH